MAEKPREWVLTEFEGMLMAAGPDRVESGASVTVIERSAYDALRAELDAALAERDALKATVAEAQVMSEAAIEAVQRSTGTASIFDGDENRQRHIRDTLAREMGKVAAACVRMVAEDRDALRAELAALRAKALRLREALGHFGEHDRDCARARFEGGRPKEGGGYEMRYAGVWYEAKPVDRTPKCDCGLDDACSPDFLSRVEGGE